MAWIFNEAAKKEENPWDWFWGSPKTQSGHRKCGCRRSDVCQCWRRKKKPKGYKWESAPPAVRARSAETASSADDDDKPWETYMTAAEHPIAQIEDTKYGDNALMQYYDTHKTFAGATVGIKYIAIPDENPGKCLFGTHAENPAVPAHVDTPFVNQYYDGDGTMDGHPTPPIYDNKYDDGIDAAAPDVDRSSRLPPSVFNGASPRFTFFTSARVPRAKVACTKLGTAIKPIQDGMMSAHYEKNKTFSGVRVYIEPNAVNGLFIRAAGASNHDVDAQDTRIPPTFMSLKEYPRAVITGGKSQDWILLRHYEKYATYAGAPIVIETGVDLDD